ncbi:MAG: hypothetical protein QOI66_1402, partial [Myxococcales bacterium]|nr:hypothetical protein [Myxococcales bacterium]
MLPRLMARLSLFLVTMTLAGGFGCSSPAPSGPTPDGAMPQGGASGGGTGGRAVRTGRGG